MTPAQYEDAVLGAALAFVILALAVIGWVWWEWTLSRSSRVSRRWMRDQERETSRIDHIGPEWNWSQFAADQKAAQERRVVQGPWQQ